MTEAVSWRGDNLIGVVKGGPSGCKAGLVGLGGGRRGGGLGDGVVSGSKARIIGCCKYTVSEGGGVLGWKGGGGEECWVECGESVRGCQGRRWGVVKGRGD